MSGPASVGLLITMPAEWASTLSVQVRCPDCSYAFNARGSGAYGDVVLFINNHMKNECPAVRR